MPRSCYTGRRLSRRRSYSDDANRDASRRDNLNSAALLRKNGRAEKKEASRKNGRVFGSSDSAEGRDATRRDDTRYKTNNSSVRTD